MSYFELKPNDLFVNTIESYPDVKFYIQSGTVYINELNHVDSSILGVPAGFISLYEYNINRNADLRPIYPFIVKDGSRNTFKTITTDEYNTQFSFEGNFITSSYNLSASISRMFVTTSATQTFEGVVTRRSNCIDYNGTSLDPSSDVFRTNTFFLRSLRNKVNNYRFLSSKFDFETYYDNNVNMIMIPSIFYGSKIKKGSVALKYYISGSLASQVKDVNLNGELLLYDGSEVTDPTPVGVVLYNEGIILLTSSAAIDNSPIDYEGPALSSSWVRFGYGANDGNTIRNSTLSASYSLEFQGTSQTQTMTIMCKAPEGQLNHSNNPTYLLNTNGGLGVVSTGSYQFIESPRQIKNIVPSNLIFSKGAPNGAIPQFQKETYVSKIALYDENRNIIGFAKMATPVRKTEDREFIFKLKLDL
jgi:hypothetical protein